MKGYCIICEELKEDCCHEHPKQQLVDEVRWEKVKKTMSENAKDDDLLEILEDSTLFYRITITELDKKIVGELETRQTIFLCGCGAFVENHNATSYNGLVNALSGAGKDYITHATLSIFPKHQYIKRTRISERIFTYWHDPESEPDWTWNGKIFYCEDISPKVLNSDVFKVMCSSGSYATVLIKQKPIDIQIQGKPVIIVTAARAIPDKEVVRRFSLVNCDESTNQTREI
ncbi:MAG: hypothetical protein ABII71_05320, partial [Candidatus Micrarchaeota archaeon]